jgi:hypothetical protein
MRLAKRWRAQFCVLAGTTAVALGAGISIASGSPVEPPSYSNTVGSGSSVTIKKTINTPPIPPNPDIVFLSDTTGSMQETIENVKANANTIMKEVNEAQPAGAVAEFAAADYKDGRPESENGGCPPDPYAYRLDQGLTTSLAMVEAGIAAWAPASGGCDEPESQINALFEVASGSIGFRSNSDRILVWFGDSPGVDPDFGHTLGDAIAALKAAHIRVIAIPVLTHPEGGLNSTGQAKLVAEETGGELMSESTTPGEVSAKILEGLKNLAVTVTPSPTCDSGLTATYDAPSKTVTSGEPATFEETLSVAPNAPDGGVLKCKVDFLLNGMSVEGFQQSVEITVPSRPTDLSLEKTIVPVYFFKHHIVAYTLTATNHGSDADGKVTITDPLPEGENFVVADPGCTFAAGVVTCELGTLAPGESVTKLVVVGLSKCAGPTITNTATVSGERPDSNPANNSASATVTVKHMECCPHDMHKHGDYGFGKDGGHGSDECCDEHSHHDECGDHGSKHGYGSKHRYGKHKYGHRR